MSRLLALSVALAFSAGAHAQTSIPDTQNAAASPQQVQLLAPQLVAFSGSQANFNALVNGLTQGVPVTLTTVDGTGTTQIVTFTPPGQLSPADAARVLENARSNLISSGIAAPSAQQIAVALVGGTLNTATGTTNVTGTIPGLTGTQLVQVRNEITTPPAPAPGLTAGLAAPTNLQALRNNLAQAGLSPFEANQALQFAGQILAQNGIVAPTAEQLQIALNGGNLLLPSGLTVPLAGVLQGRLPATGIPTAGTGLGFPTAGATGVQIPTPTTPTAGTPQFGNVPSPANNAAAAAGSSGGAQGARLGR